MPFRVTFDLEDADLRYFRKLMKKARDSVSADDEPTVIKQAAAVIEEIKAASVPAFVRSRIERLQSLVDMLEDEEWALAAKERGNVLAALKYFADPADLIPDEIPVLGYIDDAIMVELVVKDLKHEMEAFDDFCRYRKEEASRNRNSNISRKQYLDVKRRELQSRMRRRRTGRRVGRGSGSRPRFRLF